MPDIVGTVQEPDVDEEMVFESQPVVGPSFFRQALKKVPEPSEQISAPKFVAPTSFYGQAAVKPKAKGPLLVLNFYSSIIQRLIYFFQTRCFSCGCGSHEISYERAC
jgi:hypothetical protein